MDQYAYPLLERVAELYKDARMEDVLLLACQHLLEPQKRMFECLLEAGLRPENCIIVGKNYSTNIDVEMELVQRGCIVAPCSHSFDPLCGFDNWFEKNLRAFLTTELAQRHLNKYDKVIVLDDGGFMHCIVNELCADVSNVIGIEQTSSGHHRIIANNIRFETISVARSYHKLLYESPYIGELGARRIVRKINEHSKDKPNVLVFGLGAIGRQTAGRLLINYGLDGCVTDINLHRNDILSSGATTLLRQNRRIIDVGEARKKLKEFDVIVGTTGSSVLTEADIEYLHPTVSLISMSSSDREFPAVPFRHTVGTVHTDYWSNGRCLINGGFPITFFGERHCIPPQQIEFTMTLLMIRVFSAINSCGHQLPMVVEQIRNMWDPDTGSAEWYTTLR